MQAFAVWPIGMVTSALALVLLLRSLPGRYVADARFELFWGTDRYMARHVELWDSVRNLGRPSPYFSPVIGTFVWVCRTIGMSPATAERALHAAMIGFGAAGAAAVYRHMARRPALDSKVRSWPPLGAWVVGLVYAFAPYVSEFLVPSGLFLHYALAPWFALAFLRGTQSRNQWGAAAMFALGVFALGALNPASLIYALTPLVPLAIGTTLILRATTWRRVAGWTVRAALLSTLCGAAALVSLSANLPVLGANLATTELPTTVYRFASWGESTRGLGSWLTYFLGGGATAANPSPLLLGRWAIALSWIVPVGAAVALWRLKTKTRLVFGMMMITALVLMVGLYPTENSAPLGRFLNFVFESVPLTKSMRNGYKAGAGLVLAQAVLFAMGADAILRKIRARARSNSWQLRPTRLATAAFASVAVLASLAGGLPFWAGELYPPRETTQAVPKYWTQAMDAINALPDDGRVLVLPGTNRSRYRWGYVGDDIFDAFLDQPHAVRSSLPQGTPEAADLLVAIDRYVTSPNYEPGVLARVAKRMGFKWIVLRNDLEWERLGVPRPADFAALRADPSFEQVAAFGRPGHMTAPPPANQTVTKAPIEDDLRPVELYEILDAPGLDQADARPPLLLAGSGESWLGLTALGLLDAFGPVGYLPTRTIDEVRPVLDRGGAVVITEGNRRRSRRVTAERNYESETLAAGATGTERPPVPLFEGPEFETVADFGTAASITASSYGSPTDTFPTSFRPSNAFDGNPRTAWVISGNQRYDNQWLRVEFKEPTEVSNIVVRQRRRPGNDPTITKLNIEFEAPSKDEAQVSSFSTTFKLSPGQTTLNPRKGEYTSLQFNLDEVLASTPSGVGFTEIDLFDAAGVRIRTDEAIKVGDLGLDPQNLAVADAQRLADRTVFVFSRSRLNAPLDEEVDMRRIFSTAATNSFDFSATLELTASTPDIVLDTLRNQNVGAYGSSRFQGDLAQSTGFNVLDGKPATAWRVLPNPGENLSIRLAPGTAPKEMTIRTPTVATATVSPIIEVSITGYRTVTNEFGQKVETTVFGGAGALTHTLSQSCFLSGGGSGCLGHTSIPLPGEQIDRIQIDLRDIQVQGAAIGKFPATINDIAIDNTFGLESTGLRRQPGECVDLLKVDGELLGFELDDSGELFESGAARAATITGSSCEPLRLNPGSHLLESTISAESALRSLLITPTGFSFPERQEAEPTVSDGDTSSGGAVTVQSDTTAIVTNGQAFGRGWFASVGKDSSVRSTAWNTMNGWTVDSGATEVRTSYQPQRWYTAALALTSFGVAISVALALPPRTRRARRARRREVSPEDPA